MKMDQLLWRLADRFTGTDGELSGVQRPEWFDRAGDLAVVDGTVSWVTPGTDGTFCHSVPCGTHPVYVGTSSYVEDVWNPDQILYTASMIVLPFAEPARIAAAYWDEGYGGYQQLEDYALLWDSRAERAADYSQSVDEPSFFPAARNKIRTEGPLYRRHNWVDLVVDQATGANVMVIPGSGTAVSGVEARDGDGAEDGDGELVCLMFAACNY
ncbi:MAG TPA: hypothetical protein VGD84_20860 [Pseudonocardiaceae bacterium]